MKLKEVLKKEVKELVYDTYLRLVYGGKEYDNISRAKMADEIVESLEQDMFLLTLCTKRELDFLDYIRENKVTEEDEEKYAWEIRTLNDKCIIDIDSCEVYDELKDAVSKTLKFYKAEEYNIYEVTTLMVGIVKTYGFLPIFSLVSIVSNVVGMSTKKVEELCTNPLFHFYCEFLEETLPTGLVVESVGYRDYYDIFDILHSQKKEFGVNGITKARLDDFRDIFYCGFPIRKKKIKKMVEAVKEYGVLQNLLFDVIDRARVMNDQTMVKRLLSDDEKLMGIVNEAMDEMPCGVMNGATPREYRERLEKRRDIDWKFAVVPQNDAHLCRRAADEFYELYFALLEYANDKYKIDEDVKKIYKQKCFTGRELSPINDYVWNHKEVIDEFVDENRYRFSEEKLEKVRGFKSAVTSDMFFVVGFEREYTEILSTEGKLYMVKGIRANLDEIIVTDNLPIRICTTLLMFDGKIVFNSFLTTDGIDFGVEIAEQIWEEKEQAIRCYHL